MAALLRKATWRIGSLAAVLSLAAAVAVAGAQETTPTTPTAPTPGGGEILLHPPAGGEPIAISLADVEGSIRTKYTIRDAEGAEREIEVTPENGASVDDILRAAGFENGYIYLEIPREDGSTIRISRTRVRSGQGWGGRTPAIYVDEEGIHFVRPLMGPDDENASDFVTVAGGPIELTQTVSSSLEVEVTAKPRKVAAGETVELSAEVLDAGVGDRFEYSWTFGDDTKRGRGQVVEHEFEQAGRYRVEVEASNLDDLARGRTVVRVGKPKAGGPDREGGGSDDDGSSTGAYDGTGGSSYGSGGGYDYGSSYDSGSSYSTPDYSTPDYSPAPTPPPPDPAPAPPATSTEPTIAGNLLADVSTPPSPSAADAASAARTGTPVDEPPDDAAGVPVAAWAGAGMLGLLLAGAGLESGRLRTLRRPSLRLPSLPRR